MTLEQQLEKIKSGKMYNDLTEELIQAGRGRPDQSVQSILWTAAAGERKDSKTAFGGHGRGCIFRAIFSL